MIGRALWGIVFCMLGLLGLALVAGRKAGE